MKRTYLILTLALTLFLALAMPAFAKGPDDRIVFGQSLTLEEDEAVPGNVVVMGGSFSMPASSTIKGDLAVFGGQAEINGMVKGDVAVAGGRVEVGDTAVIKGELAVLGGEADISETAEVRSVTRLGAPGGSHFGDDFGDDFFEDGSPSPPSPPSPEFDFDHGRSLTGRIFGFIEDIVSTIATLIALVVISWLVATFMPQQMQVAGDAITEAAPMSFGMGLGTVFLAVALIVGLAITICLSPFSLLVAFLLMVAMLFGWIVMGQIVGERLLTAGGHTYPNFVFSTIVGVAVLTIVVSVPQMIGSLGCLCFPFGLIGFVLYLLVGLTGLGAVILTRFGTQPYSNPNSGHSGGFNPHPRSRPPSSYAADTDDDLEVNSASEEELKAKIRAALDEKESEPDPDEPEEPKPKA